MTFAPHHRRIVTTALLSAVLVLTALCGSAYAQGQFDPGSLQSKTDQKTFQTPDVNSLLSSANTQMMTVMDGPIDPNTYVVGPTDIFYVAVWGPVPVAFTVPVTPEGTLILPTIGEASVADLTLREMKQVVTRKIRDSYKLGTISVSLLQPRQMKVIVRGSVPRPGQYIVSSVDRVDYIVRLGAETQMYKPTMSIPATVMSGVKSAELEIPKFKDVGKIDDRSSLRYIQVIHRRGDTSSADLRMYYATGDPLYNPHVADGDIIIVPAKNIARRSISVHGAVNSPGVYEFVPGDKLRNVIAFADGLRPDRNTDLVIVTSRDGVEKTVDLASGQDPELANGDRIFVDPNAVPPSNYTIQIDGEINGPGRYPIVPGVTKLSEIIELAGGLTPNALPAGSGVFRLKSTLGEDASTFLEMQETIRAYPFVPSDSAFFLLNNQVGIDPVNVNMYKLLVEHKSDADITLENGDYIYVAKDRKAVLVQGQVQFPGYIPIEPGAKMEYYIEKAGGFTEYADDSGTRIIKMATRTWLEPDEAQIETGDVIWIPKEPVRDFAYYLSIVKDVGGLLSSLVTIGLIVVQIKLLSERN